MGPLIGVHRTVGMPGRHASAEAKLQHAFTNRNELTNADGGVDGAADPRRQKRLGSFHSTGSACRILLLCTRHTSTAHSLNNSKIADRLCRTPNTKDKNRAIAPMPAGLQARALQPAQKSKSTVES